MKAETINHKQFRHPGRFCGMNRAIISVFLAAVVILLISSHETFASRQRYVPGTPPREIQHASGTFRPSDLGTKNISLTLWSSNDAASRIQNMQQATKAAKDPNLTHVGINLEDSPEMFRDFLHRDNLSNNPTQFLVTDEVAHSLASTYGYGTWYY